MILKDIDGNEKLIQRLKSATLCENISHAYIFEGDSCVDKQLIAECFVKAALCEMNKGTGCDECSSCRKINHGNHEDVIYVHPEGASIKDASVEELQARLKKKPFAGERNIAIIANADTMTARAQNRLLKTLEEPQGAAMIILLSENTENLIPTILSRCVVYRVNHFGTDGFGRLMEAAGQFAENLREGQPFYKLKAELSEVAKDKEEAYMFLDALETVYRDLALDGGEKGRLHKKEDIYHNVGCVEEARRDLQRGIGVGYAMKNMTIRIGG